ncbi:hypothetical protein L195_g024974 [Trifolium pratense]|uniref:Uncharacterized protein n=1 Tax=Trifolium pratense TaxID=57577 RepID=A0A2K3NF56_TRIPR|nr:hypothetical protein L195_g024974 [Trifolium pratense]
MKFPFPSTMVFVLVLLILMCFESLPHVMAQSNKEAKALDVILQQYAYKALVNPKTGTIYNATKLPSNLTGIEVAALRLRSGSLRRKGFHTYNEFDIPNGVIVHPYVERLVFVYQNLGIKLSNKYYPLPNYTYLAPVLGLLAYDASNLSATNLSELGINASGDNILVKFQDVKSPPQGLVAKCVWFDLQGSSNFSNVKGGNTCSTPQQGHFSIVVKSTNTSPLVPIPKVKREKSSNKKVWIIVGSVVGGLVLLVLFMFLVLCISKYKHKKKMQGMEKAADSGETLQMASIGDTKAPAATVTRTQPTLEHEYAP